MTGDLYIQSVIDNVPQGLLLRHQIEMELRSHIAERLANGQPLEEVLTQLGDPLTLAESYLAAVPLQSVRFLPRVAAKLIDMAMCAAIVVAVFTLLWAVLPGDVAPVLPVICLLFAIVGFVPYTAFAEYRYGRTIGKRLMGIQVVRESGARIQLGQALLRQLPFLGQFYVINALIALVTERHQRAFEMLTKTRAVVLVLGVMVLGASGVIYPA